MKKGHKVIKDVKLRFLSHISNITNNLCMEWNEKNLFPDGYGQFTLNGKNMRASRASIAIWRGINPKKLYVLHKCDNTRCVNPDHLFLGTQKQNAQDCVNKKRHFNKSKTHCAKGHLLSEDNVYYSKQRGLRSKSRRCKTCCRSWNKKFKKARNERLQSNLHRQRHN